MLRKQVIEPAAEVVAGQHFKLPGTHKVSSGVILSTVDDLMRIESKLHKACNKRVKLPVTIFSFSAVTKKNI
ncbi:hypothetical protein D3C80_1981760 [compost metagenome]